MIILPRPTEALWRNRIRLWREYFARRLYVLAYKVGGEAEFERSKEYLRVVPSASQVEQARIRQRELLDIVEKAAESRVRAPEKAAEPRIRHPHRKPKHRPGRRK